MTAVTVRPSTVDGRVAPNPRRRGVLGAAGCPPFAPELGRHPALDLMLGGARWERVASGVRMFLPDEPGATFTTRRQAWQRMANAGTGPAAETGVCSAASTPTGGSGALEVAGPGVSATSSETREAVVAW